MYLITSQPTQTLSLAVSRHTEVFAWTLKLGCSQGTETYLKCSAFRFED